MFRSLVLAAALLSASGAHAYSFQIESAVTKVATGLATQGIVFKVGDVSNYSLDLSILKGTMVMKVTAASPESVTIQQDADLQIQKQTSVIVLNPNTGEIKSITVNGQAQPIPDPKDSEVVSQTMGEVTVPAGTFKCVDVKIHDKKNNTDMEEWANPSAVPVGGMLKMATKQQGMDVTAALTSFTRAP